MAAQLGVTQVCCPGVFLEESVGERAPTVMPALGQSAGLSFHLACEGCTACTAAVGTLSEPRTRGDSVLCSLPVFMVLGGFSRDH